MEKFLLFGKYDPTEVTIRDPSIKKYVNLSPVLAPHTCGRHAKRPFGKSKMNIVERLINNMMRTEKYTGKKSKAYNVVKKAFEHIESREKRNPLQVLIEAIENAAPREEVTRLKYGGIAVPKSVDVAPSRRIDVALRNLCVGAINATYRKSTPMHVCLAREIMLAAKGDPSSYAIAKKDEVERIAESAR